MCSRYLSQWPEVRIGSDEMWDQSEAALRAALDKRGLEYVVNEGDGAFYGPKIDMHMTDSLGRSWQLGTVQLDYNFPERFDLTYIGPDDQPHRVVMLHRALLGSFERFIGILIEETAGELPFWLAPTHVAVLPVSDRHVDYAREVRDALRAAGLRVEVDERTESISRKIREAELQKTPYMMILGDREAEGRTISLRGHGVRAEVDGRTESVGRKIRDAELRKVPFMLVVGDREAEDGTVAVREHRHGDTGSEPVDAFAQRVAARTRARSA